MAAPVVISRGPAMEHGTSRDLSAKGHSQITNNGHAHAFGSSPNVTHGYGASPGDSRIVYSLQQLLTLASSPLSQKSAANVPVPSEISRSPEKQASIGMVQGSVSPPDYIATTLPLSSPPAKTTAATPRTFGRHSFSNSGSGSSMDALSTSPTSSRSPGDAFNFSKGPRFGRSDSNGSQGSSHGLGSGTSSAFKERLAAASAAAREQQRHANAGIAVVSGKEGDVPFDMDM